MRITIKDIARELNIAPGTVSKALSKKRGVSPRMRAEVTETAKRMGYKVNRVAQTLARAPICIGVIIPRVWQEYYGEIAKGIAARTAILRDYNVEVEYFYISTLHSGDEMDAAVKQCVDQEVDGVLLCPASVTGGVKSISLLREHEIPTVLVGTYIKDMPGMPVVRLASNLAGRLAAEFMSWCMPAERGAAIFIGNKDIVEHQEKVNGFHNEIQRFGREVVGVYETQDDPDLAYMLTKKILNANPSLGGIYVATGNSVAVCRCIADQDAQENVRIVGTDIFQDMLPYVERRIINAIIHQDPARQGDLALMTLFQHLTNHIPLPSETLVRPNIALSCNISDYLNV